MAISRPTGVSSNMPIGGRPYLVIKPLTTILVEVLIKVRELARIEAKARGISNFATLTFDLRARPVRMGRKKR
jgi:hypothetical protein